MGPAQSLPTPASSHTATEQWQSFEIRMRHRRAERCVLRAEVALEAGFDEDARAALDEARRLNSRSPDFDTVRAAVAERLAADLAWRRAMKRHRLSRIGAAALLFLTIGAGVFWAAGEPPSAVTTAVASEPPAGSVSSSATSAAARETTPEAKTAPVRSPELPVATTARPAVPGRTQKAVESARPKVPPAPALPQARTAAVAFPSTATPIERVAAGLPALAPPRETSVASPDDASRLEEPRVLAALAGYEALARTFEPLESQRIALGHCSVSIDGVAARADCSGRGGPRSQPRQWQFELSKANGAWLITRVEAKYR